MFQEIQHHFNEMILEIPFEIVFVFGFVVICSLTARRLKQPAVIGCFIGGFFIHVIITLTGIDFTHQLPLKSPIIMMMIALLIFNEGLHVDMENLLENKEEILTLSILGTLVGVVLCAFVFKIFFGLGLAVAIMAGAMLIPTDAGAVLAILSHMGVKPRWRSLVGGESIFNDPFGLIIFGFAVAVFFGEDINWSRRLTVIILGSPLLGMGLGYLFYKIYRLLNDPVAELILSGMLFLCAYFGAEHFHMSGFLSVALASIFVGNKKEFVMDSETRETLTRVWEAVAISVEGYLFLMIARVIPLENLLIYLPIGLLAIVIVMFARSVSVHSLLWILDKKFNQNIPFKWRVIVDFSGLHVGVTMAILLSLPATIPKLAQIKAMGYYVIIWSVIAMPLLVKYSLHKIDAQPEN